MRILAGWCKACVCMCVCLCVFPVSSVNQSVNRHLWAAGHLAPAQLPRRGEELLTSTHTHTQTKYACTDKQYIATHRHTNIHKHTDPLDNTNSHKHISLGSHRRQTLPCLLPRRKLSQEGARDQHLSFPLLCLSPLFFCVFLFLSDISASTLRSVYLSKATTPQVLLLSKSKSGKGWGGKFPDEHASWHTQENVNRAWSISDNK